MVDPYDVISEAGDVEGEGEEDEPTFCGNRGKRCRHIFSHCDYHTDWGDWEYHRRRDRELEEE
jgi:hypothetical protein